MPLYQCCEKAGVAANSSVHHGPEELKLADAVQDVFWRCCRRGWLCKPHGKVPQPLHALNNVSGNLSQAVDERKKAGGPLVDR